MKKTVALIYGGEGFENGISKISAESLFEMIDKSQYGILKIEIQRNGEWYIRRDGKSPDVPTFPIKIRDKSGFLTDDGIIPVDCAIPCLHGDFGEDGVIQGLLSAAHISYVGQDVYASAVTSDKLYAKAIAQSLGIPVAKYVLLSDTSASSAKRIAELSIGYPMFLKPVRLGSSYGAHPIYKESEFKEAYEDAVSYSDRIIAEELIDFDFELECALFNGNLIPNGRITSSEKFYSYERKYNGLSDTSPEICLAYSSKIQDTVKSYSQKLVLASGLHSIARLDFFVTKQENVIFNEINSFPGMTKSSLYPRLTELCGLKSGEFINKLIASRCCV